LASKRDPDEYDGRKTIIDGPPSAMDEPAEEDPEEKATELWAASALFHEAPVARREPEEADTEFDPRDTSETEGPLEQARTTELARSEAEENDTDLVRANELIAGELEVKDPAHDTDPGEDALYDSVEVTGEVGEAARVLAEDERRRRVQDPSCTQVVDVPKKIPRLSCECRICGRKTTVPARVRFRGSPHSDRGFRCDKCSNIFCATHVRRVSGLWESLFSRARFHCLLCVPEAQPKDPSPRT
jgi:hypothetical protein